MSDQSIAASLALAFLATEQTATMNASIVEAPSSSKRAKRIAKLEETPVAMTAPNAQGADKLPLPTKGSNATPSDNSNRPKGIELPAKGSVGARDFFKLYNEAGHRKTDQGVLFTDPREVRDDKIKAIAAYIGYDKKLMFGDNELRARTAAAKEIREEKGGVIAVDPNAPRRPIHTVAGFVAGVPDGQRKAVLDLLAREGEAAEAMSTFEQKMEAATKGSHDFLLNQGLMLVEQQRLGEIRKQLKQHGAL